MCRSEDVLFLLAAEITPGKAVISLVGRTWRCERSICSHLSCGKNGHLPMASEWECWYILLCLILGWLGGDDTPNAS